MKTQHTFIMLLLCVTSAIVYAQTPDTISKQMICKTWYGDKYENIGEKNKPAVAASKNDYITFNTDGSMVLVESGEPPEKGTWTFDAAANTITMTEKAGANVTTMALTVIKLTDTELVVKTKTEEGINIIIYFKTR